MAPRRHPTGSRVLHTILRALRDPLFPMTYLVRNLVTLRKETHWKSLPCRVQKDQLLRILWERSAFFLEVKRWRMKQEEELSPAFLPLASNETHPCDHSYCFHCGGCCEIPSGLAVFISRENLPPRWIRIYGEGLGRGHRFCPFLWELGGSGKSLCAIHPWRPQPCRSFEEDECEYLLNDPDFQKVSGHLRTSMAHQWLIHLVDRR